MKRFAITYDNPSSRAPNDSVCKALQALGGTITFPPAGPETTIAFLSNENDPIKIKAAIVSGLDKTNGSAMVSYRIEKAAGHTIAAFTWPTADTAAARATANWKSLF
ncbi:hypothetical protein ABMY26_07370 (plasmid) [Azospirillum sp. HJ39]|uniref:hypothetical protein n=1 Tax=Azospirillum sp. HJ39 TaxID=3159496 RepID=UPI003558987F